MQDDTTQDNIKTQSDITLLKNNWRRCPENKALLGLDVGKKTIGLAMSNPDQTIATPFETISRHKFTSDAQAIVKTAHDYDIKGYIVGYPINMDGTEGPRAQSIRDFAIEFKNYLIANNQPSWIALWDERLSTTTVEELVDKHVHKRKTKINKKSSGLIDKLAAQIILDGALSFINNERLKENNESG